MSLAFPLALCFSSSFSPVGIYYYEKEKGEKAANAKYSFFEKRRDKQE